MLLFSHEPFELDRTLEMNDTRIDAMGGVNFSARFGELSFLVGPSGCGKTTLISVIAGLLGGNKLYAR